MLGAVWVDALGSSKVLVINNLNSRFQESTLDRSAAVGLVKSVHLFSFPAILDLFLVVFAVTSPASSCFAPGNGAGGVCGRLALLSCGSRQCNEVFAYIIRGLILLLVTAKLTARAYSLDCFHQLKIGWVNSHTKNV